LNDLIYELQDAGADVRVRDADGNSALHVSREGWFFYAGLSLKLSENRRPHLALREFIALAASGKGLLRRVTHQLANHHHSKYFL